MDSFVQLRGWKGLVVDARGLESKFLVMSGTIEAIKWLALVLMTMDHVNRYLFNDHLPWFSELSRMAMPLFAFVLAYNLARPCALERGVYVRMMWRLLVIGVVAEPFYWYLNGADRLDNISLNVMFTLLLATAVMYLVAKGGNLRFIVAISIFTVGGMLVSYLWFAPLFCFAAFWFCKQPSRWSLGAMFGAGAALYFANLNFWALGAMVIILAAPLVNVQVDRMRNVFYAYYPVHLAAIWLVARIV